MESGEDALVTCLHQMDQCGGHLSLAIHAAYLTRCEIKSVSPIIILTFCTVNP
jgi:hypothetical protein